MACVVIVGLLPGAARASRGGQLPSGAFDLLCKSAVPVALDAALGGASRTHGFTVRVDAGWCEHPCGAFTADAHGARLDHGRLVLIDTSQTDVGPPGLVFEPATGKATLRGFAPVHGMVGATARCRVRGASHQLSWRPPPPPLPLPQPPVPVVAPPPAAGSGRPER